MLTSPQFWIWSDNGPLCIFTCRLVNSICGNPKNFCTSFSFCNKQKSEPHGLMLSANYQSFYILSLTSKQCKQLWMLGYKSVNKLKFITIKFLEFGFDLIQPLQNQFVRWTVSLTYKLIFRFYQYQHFVRFHDGNHHKWICSYQSTILTNTHVWLALSKIDFFFPRDLDLTESDRVHLVEIFTQFHIKIAFKLY